MRRSRRHTVKKRFINLLSKLRFHRYLYKMASISIYTHHENIIEQLVHSLVLKQKSTIYRDNPRTYYFKWHEHELTSTLIFCPQDVHTKIVNKYDQEIPQSQTADNPMAPRGRDAQPSRDTRKTNKAKQPALSSPPR